MNTNDEMCTSNNTDGMSSNEATAGTGTYVPSSDVLASDPPQPPATIITLVDTGAVSDSPASEAHDGNELEREDMDDLDKASGSSCSSSSSDESAICTICTLPVAREHSVRLDPCLHREFCHECIFKWLSHRPTCPLCRARVGAVQTLENLVIIDNDDEAEESNDDNNDDNDDDNDDEREDWQLDEVSDFGLQMYGGGTWHALGLF